MATYFLDDLIREEIARGSRHLVLPAGRGIVRSGTTVPEGLSISGIPAATTLERLEEATAMKRKPKPGKGGKGC